jgi:hypothetical protein
MKTETFKKIILFAFLGVILGFILYSVKSIREIGYPMIIISLLIGQVTGLFLFLLDSEIHRTKYFKFLVFGFIIFLIGSIFKVQHWSKSTLLISFGLIIVLVTYLLRFINKKNKKFLDYIKIIWMATVFVGFLFKIIHWLYGDLFISISSVVFWIGLLYILYDFKFKLFFKK